MSCVFYWDSTSFESFSRSKKVEKTKYSFASPVSVADPLVFKWMMCTCFAQWYFRI